MAILKLLSRDLETYQPLLKRTIQEAIPPISNDGERFLAIYSALLSDKMQAWVVYDEEKEEQNVVGLVLTSLFVDAATNARSLIIYAIYGLSNVPERIWTDCLQKYKDYAKKIQCEKVIAYVANEFVLNKCIELGADTSYTFCSFDVGEQSHGAK